VKTVRQKDTVVVFKFKRSVFDKAVKTITQGYAGVPAVARPQSHAVKPLVTSLSCVPLRDAFNLLAVDWKDFK